MRIIKNLFLLTALLFTEETLAQTDPTFNTVNFSNSYSSQIGTALFSANPNSGLVLQTNGSINYGLNGHLPHAFGFRWMAHQDAPIDYSTDQDQIMKLDGFGNLNVKSTVSAPILDYSNIAYTNQIRSGLYQANFRSGTIMESSGSINFGMTGAKLSEFSFRWLIHDNGSINYAGDEDVMMSLHPTGLLRLKGTMNAQKVKVTQEVWPDYVFNADYALPSLQQVESYIKEHKHLEDIPSASEIKENGLDVGQQQAKLLQKIEELTLYIIELNKKVEQQEKKINALEKK